MKTIFPICFFLFTFSLFAQNNWEKISSCTPDKMIMYYDKLFISLSGGIYKCSLPDTIFIKVLNVDDMIDFTILYNFLYAYKHGGTQVYDPKIYRNYQAGNSWSTFYTGIGDCYIGGIVIANGRIIIGSYGNRIKISDDGGKTWMESNVGMPSSGVIGLYFVSEDKIFADTFDGLYLSTDRGNNWQYSNIKNTFVKVIRNQYTNSIFVSSNSGIFKSTDGGKTWLPSNSGLLTSNVLCITYDQGNKIIYVGTDSGLFYTVNDGISWKKYDMVNMKSQRVNNIIVSNNYLVISTNGGIYKNTTIPTDVKDKYIIPVSAKLYQNYPNPFNLSTTIEYDLMTSEYVSLTVYDQLGREIKTLVNEFKSAGIHKMQFDGTNLASGVYWYRIKCGAKSETRKLVLIK